MTLWPTAPQRLRQVRRRVPQPPAGLLCQPPVLVVAPPPCSLLAAASAATPCPRPGASRRRARAGPRHPPPPGEQPKGCAGLPLSAAAPAPLPYLSIPLPLSWFLRATPSGRAQSSPPPVPLHSTNMLGPAVLAVAAVCTACQTPSPRLPARSLAYSPAWQLAGPRPIGRRPTATSSCTHSPAPPRDDWRRRRHEGR